MFGRILWKLLRGNRGRLAVALVAVISGAAVVSALLTIEFDISRKLTQEFRLLGPNIVVSGKNIDESVDPHSIQALNANVIPARLSPDSPFTGSSGASVAASAPFYFAVVRVSGTAVIAAGTWLDQLPKLNPTWRIAGNWISSRDDEQQCLIGRKVAQQFEIAPGGEITLNYTRDQARFRVAGVIDSGAAEDNQVFLDLPAAWKLTDNQGFMTLWQLNVDGTGPSIGNYARGWPPRFLSMMCIRSAP